jgi:hypothetical protein
MAPVKIIAFVLVAAITALLSFLRYLEFSIRGYSRLALSARNRSELTATARMISIPTTTSWM